MGYFENINFRQKLMSFGQLFIQTSGHIIDSRVIQTRIVLIVVSCPIHNLGTARLRPAKFSSKFFLKYDPSSMQHWDSNLLDVSLL